jgi:hypothetical protein
LYFFEKTYLNLFRQDIKKIILLKAFQQSLNSGQKTAEKPNFGKKSLPLHRSRCKSLFSIFVSASFLPKVSKRLKVEFSSLEMVKMQGSAKLSPLSLSPPPSEFCNHEKNSVIRSAMDALRNSKKN